MPENPSQSKKKEKMSTMKRKPLVYPDNSTHVKRTKSKPKGNRSKTRSKSKKTIKKRNTIKKRKKR